MSTRVCGYAARRMGHLRGRAVRRRAVAGVVVAALSLPVGAQTLTGPAAGPALPSSEVPVAARQVFEGTMSPFCPELLLANCPSPQADSLRRAVAARAAAGESRAHIEADLLATYGDVVRAAPPRRGFGLVAWLAPAALLGAAGGWVTRWARRSAQAHPRRSPDETRLTAHDCAPATGTPSVAGIVDPERDVVPVASPEALAALEALLRRG